MDCPLDHQVMEQGKTPEDQDDPYRCVVVFPSKNHQPMNRWTPMKPSRPRRTNSWTSRIWPLPPRRAPLRLGGPVVSIIPLESKASGSNEFHLILDSFHCHLVLVYSISMDFDIFILPLHSVLTDFRIIMIPLNPVLILASLYQL